MRKAIFITLVIASCTLLTSCGGSMSASSTTTTSGGVPMSLTIGDSAPKDVAVVFLEALITDASLQPMDTTKSPVSMLSTPTEFEFGHLQTDTAFVSLTNVPPDTYTGLNLKFGSAVLTVVNHSANPVGGCMPGSVCELTPSISTMVTISSTPFPVTIDENSVVGIRLDLNVDSSVQPDLTISPAVTISRLTQRDDSEEGMEMERIDEIDGQVTTVGSSQFTLMNERSEQSFTIMVDSNTVFEDFAPSTTCTTPANFNCVQKGQIVSVDLSENGVGSMLGKLVEFEEDPTKEAIKGTITSVDCTQPTQFHMVVYNEELALGGVSEGSPVGVMIDPNAMFQVGSEELGEDGGFSISGLTFGAACSGLMVGQNVQIRPETASTNGGMTTLTTNLVRLWPSQITGQVGTASPTNGTFVLMPLSPLFTDATPKVPMINVVTLSNMNFEDFSGFSSLTAGSTVSVRGLLFNTPGTPTLVTRTMREEGGGGSSD